MILFQWAVHILCKSVFRVNFSPSCLNYTACRSVWDLNSTLEGEELVLWSRYRSGRDEIYTSHGASVFSFTKKGTLVSCCPKKCKNFLLWFPSESINSCCSYCEGHTNSPISMAQTMGRRRDRCQVCPTRNNSKTSMTCV